MISSKCLCPMCGAIKCLRCGGTNNYRNECGLWCKCGAHLEAPSKSIKGHPEKSKRRNDSAK